MGRTHDATLPNFTKQELQCLRVYGGCIWLRIIWLAAVRNWWHRTLTPVDRIRFPFIKRILFGRADLVPT